ncbi:hypothetical protein EVAR_58151_1 [Eumeta japonica]|uniref:Uncharacterized protein n=1 Tax=Eumeta variegata TaxID=151549 RepID=A0A4C1X0L8_EUMVA|nr:hypothetical protein EVAR_58151_1 [Eumeta japonica]
MGRGQELLDGARNGDVQVVEKILAQITRRGGPIASLEFAVFCNDGKFGAFMYRLCACSIANTAGSGLKSYSTSSPPLISVMVPLAGNTIINHLDGWRSTIVRFMRNFLPVRWRFGMIYYQRYSQRTLTRGGIQEKSAFPF